MNPLQSKRRPIIPLSCECRNCTHLYKDERNFLRCPLKPKLIMTGSEGWCEKWEQKDFIEEQINNKSW